MSMKLSLGVMVALVGVIGVSGCGDDDPEGTGGAGGAGAAGSSSSSATSSSSSSSSASSSSSSTGVGAQGGGGFGGEGGTPVGGAGGLGGEGGTLVGGAGGDGGAVVGGAGGQGGDGGTAVGGQGGQGGNPVADGTCAAPYPINSGDVASGDTTGLTGVIEEGCGTGSGNPGEIVYQFTPTVSGTALIVLDPDFDGVLEARTDCGAVTTAIDCDDVVSGNEVLFFGVSAGQPLYIIVDGYNTAAVGTFTLSINPGEPVCNDGLDDNANGLKDCEDPACLSDASCAPVTAACTAAPALAATQTGDTTASGSNFSSDIAGSFCGFGSGVNDAVYSYTSPGVGLLDLGLTGDTGQGLYVRTDCDDGLARISCNNLFVSPDQLYSTLLPGQNVWVYVDGSTAADVGPYTLTSNFIAFTSTEVEPNNGSASANTAAASNTGIITPAESDWYAVTVPGPASNISAETVDTVTAPALCTSQSADTFITIYAADGTTVLDTDEDGGDGYCSLATATALAAGTYYVRVQGSPSYASFDQMAYQLDVTVTP